MFKQIRRWLAFLILPKEDYIKDCKITFGGKGGITGHVDCLIVKNCEFENENE